MNETINLEPRQKAILNVLAQNQQLSREQITEKVASMYPASKATIARDLLVLVKQKRIQAIGKGPSRTYKIVTTQPLLSWVDLDQYFITDLDQRLQAKTSFSFDIFDKLSGLLFPEERKNLQNIFRSFMKTAERLDPTLRKKELERFMIELSWKSSKIEGNTYSLLETEALITQSQEAAGKTKQEAIMILNHKDACTTIFQNRKKFNHLSFHAIGELHNSLIKGLSITTGIRKHAVGITGTRYLPLDNEWQIKEAVEKCIDVVNAAEHPLEKALIISAMTAYIQPFTDGNKRTARMLGNAVLMAHDYFPLSYRSVDEQEYKKALILFYETNNLYHVKRLFLDQYRFALRTYFL